MKRAGKRIERARLQAGSKPIRAAGSRHARSLLASHARPGHVATSKSAYWARARRATRDFLARPAGGPHAKTANGALRSDTKSGARVAAAAQVLGMGHVRAIATSNALTSPSVAPLAARATMGATTHLLIGASGAAFIPLSPILICTYVRLLVKLLTRRPLLDVVLDRAKLSMVGVGGGGHGGGIQDKLVP